MRVAILRPKEYAERTKEELEREGFEVVAVPFIKIVPDEEGIRRIKELGKFDYVIVTSQTSARILVESGFRHGAVIAIGKRTADVLRSAGMNPITPKRFDSRSICEEFGDLLRGKRVAVVRSDKGDPVLKKLATEEFVVYRIEFEHGEEQMDLIRNMNFDAIVFSSSMMVRSFFELARKMGMMERVLEGLRGKIVVAIGPPTRRVLEEYGIKAVMPEEYTFDGVLNVLRKYQKPS